MTTVQTTETDLSELGQQLRVDAVRCTSAAASGHATSALSAADLMAVLLARHLRYDFDAPRLSGNDRLIFSKGHASPLLYAMLRAVGAITEVELLTYRQKGSRLEGHPTPRLPWVDVATGSLGQGLPVGVGMALAGQRLDALPYRVWVLCGDGELTEGSMWEAFAHASDVRLDKLTAIVDVNRLGQRGPTRHEWDCEAYAAKMRAFGWHTVEIDGHDPQQIDEAYAAAAAVTDRPSAVLARTVKGKGVRAVEDRVEAHGKPTPNAADAVAELGGRRSVRVAARLPDVTGRKDADRSRPLILPTYDVGSEAATRDAFGEALSALGDARGDVVALDSEVSDSTRSGFFAQNHPERFFECYIAEQQMIGAAVGLQACGWTPYATTFAAFLSRAYDFIRMASIGGADLRIVGSHAGVSIGQDGPSQMGLEDIAMFRPLWRSTVLYPCDANQTAQLVSEMADCSGVSYLRTTRGETPVIYAPDERFPVGGSRVLRQSWNDQVTLVGAGVTTFESLRAADLLAARGIAARVIDAYSVKPLDAQTLREACRATGGRVVVSEDHWPEGGLGDAILEALT
ncbi:MAG: transketolase, partial [Stackebrandtia sp.]